GAHFYDDRGQAYLDFSSQLMCANLGHGNRAVIEAIREQAERLPYVAPSFVCEAKARAVEALLEVMPQGLDQFFFSTSGTEANEAALKIIHQYMEPQRKYKIISRYRSYHGSTSGSIALTGDHRRWLAEPVNKIPGVIFAPDAYCYRCSLGLRYPDCNLQCAEYVDYMIKEEGNVAAIFIEPVVGTNGVIVPPKEYLPRLREIADANGVLLVADEVMSGWYRTGEWFAVDHWNVKPDILTTAKGCTGAYAPVGLTATTGEIRDYFEERFFSHGHTYTMHPLVIAAIPAAIEEYKKLMATGAPQRVGEHLSQRLQGLMERHESIGDVRGLGHFWAVELVKDRETKEPFNTKADKAALKPLMVDRLAAELLKRGLYVVSWYNHFVIAPPLTITEEEIDEGLEIFDEVLEIADREAD
ncbi:MAG: aspartate aminotransferase family protein, partial [Candidatus Bipolaricaulia bacterium]